VGGYQAVELLGSGGTGEVWRARVRESGEEVALKRLRPGAQPADRALLRREASALVAVRHRHIIDLHEVLATGDGLVLVLELARGGDLAALLQQRGTLTVPEIVAVLEPVAQALAAAHVAGMVHGDVSAANILLRVDGTPVLGDLGTARLVGRSRDRTLVTCAYADPHVAAGAEPDPAADLFGLAAVGWHMATGSPLWDAVRPEEVVDLARRWSLSDADACVVAALSADAPAGASPGPHRGAWAALPESLRHVLLDTLAPYRAVRASAREFAERVGAVCAPSPVVVGTSATPPSVSTAPAVTIEVPGHREEAPPTAESRRTLRTRSERGARSVRERLRGLVRLPRTRLPGSRRAGTRLPGSRRARFFVVIATTCAAAGLGLAAHSMLLAGPMGSATPRTAAVTSPPVPSTGSPSATPSSEPTAQSASPAADGPGGGRDSRADAWTAEVRALVEARTAAYATLDVDLLADVYAPDAPALPAEAERIASLSQQATPVAMRHEILTAKAESFDGGPAGVPAEVDRVVLLVQETVPSGQSSASEVRQVRMTLARVGPRWLLYDVTGA